MDEVQNLPTGKAELGYISDGSIDIDDRNAGALLLEFVSRNSCER